MFWLLSVLLVVLLVKRICVTTPICLLYLSEVLSLMLELLSLSFALSWFFSDLQLPYYESCLVSSVLLRAFTRSSLLLLASASFCVSDVVVVGVSAAESCLCASVLFSCCAAVMRMPMRKLPLVRF